METIYTDEELCASCKAKKNDKELGKNPASKPAPKDQETHHDDNKGMKVGQAPKLFEHALQQNKALPCNDNSPCPYSNDMECDTCKAMTGEERDALEAMDDMKVEVDTEKAKKITRERR